MVQKVEEEGIYPNSLYEAKITLAPELDKDITVEKNLSWIYMQKSLTKF